MAKRRPAAVPALAAAAALAVYVALVAAPAGRTPTGGFAAHYGASRILAERPSEMARVYDDAWFAAQLPGFGIDGIHDVFWAQPPTMSLVMLPVAGLPADAARLAWTLLSVVLLPIGLLVLARAMRVRAAWACWTLPLCLLYRPLTENVRSGQAYLLMFALLCLVFHGLVHAPDGYARPPRSRAVLAGVALGAMLALKTAGAWLWPAFLLGRRPRVIPHAIAAALLIALVTLPWIGPEAWAEYGRRLPELAVTPKRYVTAYQTVTSLFGHLFVHDAKWNPAPVAHLPVLAGLLTLGAQVGTLAVSVRAARMAGSEPRERALTAALFMALVVANAPLGEDHHYLMVLPALVAAFWIAVAERVPAGAAVALAAAAFLLGAPLPYETGRLQGGVAAVLAYPRVYGAFVLWGWLLWAMRREPAREVRVERTVVAGGWPGA